MYVTGCNSNLNNIQTGGESRLLTELMIRRIKHGGEWGLMTCSMSWFPTVKWNWFNCLVLDKHGIDS